MRITKRQLRRIIKEQQMTLNQDEVNTVAAMANTVDGVWNQFRNLKSVPPQWLDDATGTDRYSKLEEMLFDIDQELQELAEDMKKGGL
jgi:hypothetical protein